jgi:predicted glycosyltransferase
MSESGRVNETFINDTNVYNNMTVLFMISHPAHFWMFKYTIDNLKRDGHKVVIVIRPKDVLEQLCIDAGMEYYKVKNRPKKWGMFGLAIFLIEKIFEVLRIARKEKPDMLVGSDGVLAVVGKLIRRPAFEMYEDDAEAIALYARMFFPLYTGVVCPHCCSAWKWEAKKYSYPSYHELGYLHPNLFKPSREVVERYGIDTKEPYILVRFAQLTAHHDVGIHGINTEVAERMIAMLKPH